jgi:hypothetical protein
MVQSHEHSEMVQSHEHSEMVQSHEDSVDIDIVYTAHVVQRARQNTIVDILDYSIPECTFVDCLDREGHMHTDVFYLQCKLLSTDWKDKAILSWKATVSIQKLGLETFFMLLLLLLLLFIFDRWHFYNPARTDWSMY